MRTRTTFRQLVGLLSEMSDEQLDSDVTIEVDDECYAAYLTFADDDGFHGSSLDFGHPILTVLHVDEEK